MTVGYVHVGPPRHGVTRYGRLLAAEARCRPDLSVLECEIAFTGEPRTDRRRVIEGARQLAGAEIIHLQYNNQLARSVWGPGWQQLHHLWLFARCTAGVPFISTVHDVYPPPATRWRSFVRHPIRQVRRARQALGPHVLTLRWLRRRAACLFVCSEEERARLSSGDTRVRVLPMFVEPREIAVSPEDARAMLDLRGKRVLTLLGFIHGRKGHRLLIEALASLPGDIVVLFAGEAPDPASSTVAELLALAEKLGVADRLRITGYVPDEELNAYLAATDLAICPFRDVSASASLATWISAGRPILASDLPLVAEYRGLEPGAIRTFRPYTARALAEAVMGALEQDGGESRYAINRLRDRLGLPSVFDRHVEVYRELISHAHGQLHVRRTFEVE